MKAIEDILSFVVEIEKLKAVQRKTMPVGLDRYENSAEHSWHICMTALMLKDYANEPVNIDRVIKMLLIHDIGEIDVGDTIIYESETQALKQQELEAIKRIFGLLPDNMAEEFVALWQEFEVGETADASFAKAIDRVPPVLHNLHGDGHSWKKHGITKEQVFGLNKRMAKGSEALWSVMKQKLEEGVEQGILK
jgi:putative hydrolase of HD superfamily